MGVIAHVILALAATGVPSPVQSPPAPPAFLAIEVEEVDPAQISRYEGGVTLLAGAIRRAGVATPWWLATSQRDNRFYYVFGVSSLDELNPRSPVAAERFRAVLEGIDERSRGDFLAATVPSPVRSVEMTVVEPVADLAYRPERLEVRAPTMLFFETHHVRHDMIERYKAVRAKIVAAARAAGYPVGWGAYRSVLGEGRGFFGDGRYYYYITPCETRLQVVEQFPLERALEKALGADAARALLAEQAVCLEGFERVEHRLRPDMCPTARSAS